MHEERTGDFIQSLERGLAVISSFSKERPALTLSEVAQAVGLTRATARRVLLTLAELGYVHQNSRTFSLTSKVLDLGYSFLSSRQILDLAQAPMERLVEEVNESSSMSVLGGMDIVYVARVPTRRIMTISLVRGSRLPAYCTSMGRVLLSGHSDVELDGYLDQVRLEPLTPYTITEKEGLRRVVLKARQDGYALVDQELEEGIRSVAAPVKNGRGDVIAAMNVSGHASRVSVASMRKDYLPRLLSTAAEVSDRVAMLRVG